MGWADNAIKKLEAGEEVIIKPTGNSMKPKIKSGASVTISPVELDNIKTGDIVLCKVKGRQYLHLVKSIDNGRFLIGNNRGYINGWTRTIYGLVTHINNG